MAIDVNIMMFISFGVIFAIFIIFYLWLENQKKKRNVETIGDLVSRSNVPIEKRGEVPSIPKDLPPNYCPVCGTNVKNQKVCSKCGYDIVRCKICQKIIKLDEDIVECPYCGEQFHRGEFLEWLKIKAFCPNCRTEMDLWEFKKDKSDDEQIL